MMKHDRLKFLYWVDGREAEASQKRKFCSSDMDLPYQLPLKDQIRTCYLKEEVSQKGNALTN